MSAPKSPTFHILTVSSNLKMRKITNSKSISENQDNLGFLINDFLSELKVDSFKKIFNVF
jgi:hypothetical protein